MPGTRKRGRPKRRYRDALREDMAEVEVTEDDAEDRNKINGNGKCTMATLAGEAERKRS